MAEVIKAPKGRQRAKWLGPAFIWMLSAAGSGEVLFTPANRLQAMVIAMTVLAAAISSRPDTSLLSKGLIPSIPSEMDLGEVLSWLGFMGRILQAMFCTLLNRLNCGRHIY